MLKLGKKFLLFAMGGGSYVGLELLWRQRSHGSMFFVGGLCFLLLGRLERTKLPLSMKGVAGSGVITGVELLTGMAVNRKHQIWDYRGMPANYRGQICLLYSVFWVPVSLFGMALYKKLDRRLK